MIDARARFREIFTRVEEKIARGELPPIPCGSPRVQLRDTYYGDETPSRSRIDNDNERRRKYYARDRERK